ncbi:MAG: hypothetical protein JWO38_1420 [Gemmataceae bacterium]|nr:hypothetical protein [Gemmataceae bacterium]
MQITCPRCRRSLSTTDPHGPPVFCMFCGQKLQGEDHTTPPEITHRPGDMRTTSHVPFSDNPDEDTEPAPEEVGGYRLLRVIGAGGMGTVYEAEAPGTGHRVAVKLLSSRLAASPASVERFRQEGRLASQLTHPRCVFVLAADTDAGRPYIVMELMPGRTLKDLVDQAGALPPNAAVAHILDVIDGLAEAHRLGVLHRDVKPSNCFLTADGRVKVGDFGLSKSLAGSQDRQLTQTGAFLGTVLFASPEQIRGEPLDYGSDVYSVCATLYYLLCGEAPYHHESVTAALVRAISEPPPPICGRRPDVPRALEKAVMKGLERARDRRWQSLDELREALVDLLPARQIPARPRLLVGAYLLDALVLILFVLLPLEVILSLAGADHPAAVALDSAGWVGWPVYFAVLEGLFGATVGKALLGLRVSRVGKTGPPGLVRGAVRAGVFEALVLWVFFAPTAGGGAAGGVAAFGLGVFGLLIQLRRTSGGYRGVHDFASGCHVTRRPLPARKLRLTSRYPNPLDDVLPAAGSDPLPVTVAGYAVRGRVWADPAGEQVWAAEDRALGRRVLLWLRPADGDPIPPAPTEVARPTRLRRLGQGAVRWGGRDLDWTAFAAPVGAPLADTVRPDRPLPWADARFLVEQLVDELQAAQADGSIPARLGLDQVWVEPNGRVRVLDFPMPVRKPTPSTLFPEKEGEDGSRRVIVSPSGEGISVALSLLRQVASLTLEGRPRVTAYPPGRGGRAGPGVHAPVPPHAGPMLTKLFAPDGYSSLAGLHRDLLDTHAHSPEVTPSLRAAQLGIQAAILSSGLFLMFGLAGAVALVLAHRAETRTGQADNVLGALRDPAKRDELARLQGAAAALNNPRAAARIEGLRARKQEEADARRRALLPPQRFVLDEFNRTIDDGPRKGEFDLRAERDLLVWAAAPEKMPAGRGASPWDPEAGPVWAVLVAVPLAWVVGAAVLRGGVSMILTGIAVVRADGRRAYRRQYAVRAAAVWLPVVALLAGSVWLQVYHPRQVYLYAGLWLVALALLPVYLVVAVRYPVRPPQDRLAGTYLVPM